VVGTGTELWVDTAQELLDFILQEEATGPGTHRPPAADISIPEEILASFALSPRQAQILRHLSQGKSNAEIGSALELSSRTVKKHLEHIYSRLGVGSRAAAVARVYGAALAAHGERDGS
jgi:DNA-binding NarL/FixJ family response regulator